MKRNLLAALTCLLAFVPASCGTSQHIASKQEAASGYGRQDGEELLVSSTIDFLDFAFYDKLGGDEYYGLDAYEQRIREMAEGGLKRIYLRTNACGVCNYPTKVSVSYGQEERLHWNDLRHSLRFASTLQHYDPCKETIRLGHKYGLEVWCWESLCDECGGTSRFLQDTRYQASAKRLKWMPLLEPAYMAHPEWQAMKRPDLCCPTERREEINAKARKYPVARILVVDSDPRGAEIRITPDEVEIYTSDDNETYTRYTGAFQCRAYRDEQKRKTFEISGLDISATYVKLAHPAYNDKRWGIAVREQRGTCKAFNSQGEEIATVWGTIVHQGADKESTGFCFDQFASAGWDYGSYQVGFCIGETEDTGDYYWGVVEFAVPAAMEFKLKKFSEVAAYDFDGYMINFRTHSAVAHPDEYGFNPEVIQKTIARCGKDPVTDESAREVLRQIRAEAIADYFKGCKKLIGDRPLYISGLPNSPENRAKAGDKHYQNKYGSLKWLYERYFADGSVDGIMMIGSDFRDEFTPEVLNGRRIKLGVFREMGFPPKGYDLKTDIAQLKADQDISEVELYETMALSFHPEKFQALQQ